MKNLFLIFLMTNMSLIFSSFSSAPGSETISKTLVFPVAGQDANIGSLWGESRGGGKRKHKGIDIFAEKGTSVLSICDGVVTAVTNRGIGGKTVWVKSDDYAWSAYYAHLDVQKVVQGQLVKKGQLLGTVGNTGNAKHTPAHLHFGIYKGRSPVNPLPFVKNARKLLKQSDLAPEDETPEDLQALGIDEGLAVSVSRK